MTVMQDYFVKLILFGIMPIPYTIMMLLLRHQWYPFSRSKKLKFIFDWYSLFNIIFGWGRFSVWLVQIFQFGSKEIWSVIPLWMIVLHMLIILIDAYFTAIYVGSELGMLIEVNQN